MLQMKNKYARFARAWAGLWLLLMSSLALSEEMAVPDEYQVLYQTLDGWLSEFSERNARVTEKASTTPIMAVHLPAGDANRGPFLAGPTALVQATLMLDMMQRMGVKGISVVIGYPLLDPSFPEQEAYKKFYLGLAKAVREKGMSFTVEQNLLFANTVFSPHQFDFESQDFDALTAGQSKMAQWIIDNLQPDYLTLFNEPQSFAAISNRPEFLVREGMVAYVEAVTQGLDRKKTKLGAGVSSWQEAEVAAALAKTPVDYLNLTFFDIAPASVERAYAIAAVAKSAQKPLVITDAWLYKSDGKDKATADAIEGLAEGFRRNAFSFWSALDSRFLTELARFSENVGAEYISPYWGNYLLAYVEYSDETMALPFEQLVLEKARIKAGSAVMSGWLSESGKHYQSVIAQP